MKTAVYAGTFDPITNGHLNVLARAAKVFDQVIIAVAADHNKQTLFTLEERTALVKESVAHLENVQAKVFSRSFGQLCPGTGCNCFGAGIADGI